MDDAQSRYIEIVKATFPKKLRLAGLRIVIDCANGAAYKVAPTVLYELGATVIPIGVNPDGYNINAGFGATAPARRNRRHHATRGVDRVLDLGRYPQGRGCG